MNGLEYYRRLFSARSQQKVAHRSSVDKSSLPSTLTYLRANGYIDSRPRGEWVRVRCPAHKGGDERHPSMSVSVIDGHFRCFACGVRGGDLIALHRLCTGLGFVDAVRDLGGRFQHD